MADFDLGGLLFGNAPSSGLEGYLDPEQLKRMQQQGVMQAAMALLKASGPSTQRIGLGQALGGAYEAGQAGYQQAQQQGLAAMMTKQKMEEAAADKRLMESLASGDTSASLGLTPEQARIVAMNPKALLPKVLEMQLGRKEADSFTPMTPEQLAAYGLPPGTSAVINAKTGKPEVLSAAEKPQQEPEKVRLLRSLGLEPTLANLRLLDSPEANPTEVKLLQAAGKPITMENIMAIRRAGATNVSVGEGQKGFENTMSLKKTFNAEPIYKDYNDMKSAYGQVMTSLDQGTPIGDVAGATKVMKLLDPGSVVRESELGIAMAASGRMDRLKNYFNMWQSGNKLTEQQRSDFKQLSNELYAAAGQAYNQKRQEYQDYGQSFGLDASKALGAPAQIPSLMGGGRGATGSAQRKPLGDIFSR